MGESSKGQAAGAKADKEELRPFNIRGKRHWLWLWNGKTPKAWMIHLHPWCILETSFGRNYDFGALPFVELEEGSRSFILQGRHWPERA